jgi:dihydrolipoamide dehydrogenase
MRMLVVIGGGLAGFAAARRASALGRRVVLIDERDKLGGYELHEGSYLRAPWLEAARRVAEARQDLAPRGLRCSVELDLPGLREHAERSLQVWQQGLAFLLRQRAVTHRQGRARVVEPGVVELDSERLVDVDIVLARGPSLVDPPGLALDGERIVALGRAAAFTQLPTRLLVLGRSVEALEWAGVWLQLGARVTLAPGGPITPDPQLDAKWLRELGRQGMRVVSELPTSLVRVGDEVEVQLGEGERARFDRVLVERVPDPADAPLLVDVGARTAQAGVAAVGGVTGTAWPADAIAEGWMVAGRLADDPGWTPLVRETIPRVIQGPVELAWVGPSKAQLDARGIPSVLGGFPALAHVRGRLVAGSGSTRGFVHLLAHAGSGRVLAAQAMGHGAAELVSEAASAIAMGASLSELGRIPRSPASWAFGLGEAARMAQGLGLLL